MAASDIAGYLASIIAIDDFVHKQNGQPSPPWMNNLEERLLDELEQEVENEARQSESRRSSEQENRTFSPSDIARSGKSDRNRPGQATSGSADVTRRRISPTGSDT